MKSAVKVCEVIKIFPTESQEQKYHVALNKVSFSIEQGSLTVIGGANGSGKSVLMNIIAGLMEPSDGKIIVSSRPGLIFQDAATQILGDTPREDVAVGPKNLGFKKQDIEQIVEKCLSDVSLLQKADYPAEFLSGGEKRRLAVASILAMNKDIIIFDEPYANLDYNGVLEVTKLILSLHEKGKTILLLTHELEKCLGLADHFLILHKGKLVFDGSPQEALSLPLENWGIRNPFTSYKTLSDLVWIK